MTDPRTSQNGEMRISIFPDPKCEGILPDNTGFDSGKLDIEKRWLGDSVGNGKYRVVIIRGGRIISEGNHGFRPNKRFHILSVVKFAFSHIFRHTSDHLVFLYN